MTLAMFLDIAMLILLAATVALGFSLNRGLAHFRQSRRDMEGLLNRLTANIDQAERAIEDLQRESKGSGARLQDIVKESKFLADELRFMNEAGNGLADRLEKLADKNRALVGEIEKAGGVGPHHSVPFDMDAEMDLLEEELQAYDAPSQARPARPDFAQDVPPLQSQAERELFEALTRGRKSAGGRRG